MLEIYLVRHPQTVANATGVAQGQLDVEPQPGYEGSIDKIAEFLSKRKVSAVFSSDLKRADIPARYLIDQLRVRRKRTVEYHSLPNLRERHLGVYQGRPHAEIHSGDVNGHIFFLDNITRGESISVVRRRINEFDEEDLRRYEGGAGSVVIMGHGYWLSYFINLKVYGSMKARPYMGFSNLQVTLLKTDGQRVIDFVPKIEIK